MNKSIQEIEKELALLDNQKSMLESRLTEAISSAIQRVAESQSIRRISKHIVLINFSDMINNPWNPSFYDWNQSIAIVQKFLRAKPVSEWRDALQKKLDESSPLTPVVFKFSHSAYGERIVETIPVSRQFIQEIIKQIN